MIFQVVRKHFQPCVHQPSIHIKHTIDTQTFLDFGRVNRFKCVPNIWENIILQDFNIFELKQLPAFIFLKVQHLPVIVLPTYINNMDMQKNSEKKRKRKRNRNRPKKKKEHQGCNNQGLKGTLNGSPDKAGTSTSSDSDVENTPVSSENDKVNRKGSVRDQIFMEDEVLGITKEQEDGCSPAEEGGKIQSESPEITPTNQTPNYKHTTDKQPKKNGRRDRFSSNKAEESPILKRHHSYNGLVNQGATCYLNSVLQTLFMTPEFRHKLMKLDVSKRKEARVSYKLKDLFHHLQSRTGSATTNGVTNALEIRNVCEQQDAAEYYQKILSMTETEAAEVFQGEKKHSTICKKGNHDPVTETNSFFSLPIAMDSDQSIIDVKNSLDALFKVTLMEGEDQLYCENCQTMTDMEMSCSILKMPDILTLHLQRFNLDYSYMIYRKNNCPVIIPLRLQLQDECGVKHEYELYAVVNHVGSLSGGHYYANICSLEEHSWYEFNDSWVQPIKCLRDGSHSKKACLLFYRKYSTVSDEMNSDDGSTDSQTAAGVNIHLEETADTDFNRKPFIHPQTTEEQDIIESFPHGVASTVSSEHHQDKFSQFQTNSRRNPEDSSHVCIKNDEDSSSNARDEDPPAHPNNNDSETQAKLLQTTTDKENNPTKDDDTIQTPLNNSSGSTVCQSNVNIEEKALIHHKEIVSFTSSKHQENRFSESSIVQTNSNRNPEGPAHPNPDYFGIENDDDSSSTARDKEDPLAYPKNSNLETEAKVTNQTTPDREIKPTQDPSQSPKNNSSGSVCQSNMNELNQESIHPEEPITADFESSLSWRNESTVDDSFQSCRNDTSIITTVDIDILEIHQSTHNDSDIAGRSLEKVGSFTSSKHQDKRFSELSTVQTNSSRNPEDLAHPNMDYSGDDSSSTARDEKDPPAYPKNSDSETKAKQTNQTTTDREIKPTQDPNQSPINNSSGSVCPSNVNELNYESNIGEKESIHPEEHITADSEPSQSRRNESISDTGNCHQSAHNDSDNESEAGAQNSSLLEKQIVCRKTFPKWIWPLIFAIILLVLLIVLVLIFVVFKL